MKKAVLGNEAIAWGLLSANVDVMSAYPGTPSSEIFETYEKLIKELKLPACAEWTTNEKVAFETAYAAAITGKRAACGMKMVGLNVASDSMMSAAYIGNKGGFLIISADDPGFYSSQTEQDSRYFAKFARIPCFDPSTPQDALNITVKAVEVSEIFEIPALLRPVLRVCHGRQIVEIPELKFQSREGNFERNIERWAAVPREPRLKQGYELLEKLKRIAQYNYENFIKPQIDKLTGKKVLAVASGTPYSFLKEVVEDINLDIDILKIDMPHPLPIKKLKEIITKYETVIVFEETYPLIEEQINQFGNVKGKLTGDVYNIDEATHERIAETFLKLNLTNRNIYVGKTFENTPPKRKPSFCPGCPHRTVFFAMKKVFGNNAIYPSDIGCYTLGLNQKAVDSLLCMGGSLGLAGGFSISDKNKPIVATIGDSTFLHSGVHPLINSITHGHKYVAVILDNSTVAMTGLQPTPERLNENIKIENIVKGCGVEPLVLHYDGKIETTVNFFKSVKEKYKSSNLPVVAVVKEFCTFDKENTKLPGKFATVDTEKCTGCGYCIETFGCPAFEWKDKKITVNRYFCVGCGVCLEGLCPTGAFVEDKR